MSKEKKVAKQQAKLAVAEKLQAAFPDLTGDTAKGKQKRALKKAAKAITAALKPEKPAKTAPIKVKKVSDTQDALTKHG